MSYKTDEVIEGVARNLEKLGFPDWKKIWVLFALKHILRIGLKDEVDAELKKVQNYIHRARTGEWQQELQPKHYGGNLENSDGETEVMFPQSLLPTKPVKAKPPIGVIPKNLFLEERIDSLTNVLLRYALEKKAPKEEWIIELVERKNELLRLTAEKENNAN